MLSVEEIKLLIEKLEKAKETDFQELIDTNLKILKDIEVAVDANNELEIEKIDKPMDWYKKDLEIKRQKPIVHNNLYKRICSKIYQFNKTNLYNSLEIGPGNGMFSKEFRASPIPLFGLSIIISVILFLIFGDFFVNLLKEIFN